MQLKYITLRLVDFFIILVETFLGLRFLLKLFGANAANGVVNWIYDMSSVLLDPFRGIFPTKVFDNQYVFEFSTLFAMVVFLVLGLLLEALINAVTPDIVESETVVAKRKR